MNRLVLLLVALTRSSPDGARRAESTKLMGAARGLLGVLILLGLTSLMHGWLTPP